MVKVLTNTSTKNQTCSPLTVCEHEKNLHNYTTKFKDDLRWIDGESISV